MTTTPLRIALLLAAAVALGGCGNDELSDSVKPDAAATPATPAAPAARTDGSPAPTFSLAWSEYPSWSVFGVAGDLGLIDGAAGKMGSVETAHDVDIVLEQLDYDTCITRYGAGAVDAVCITNMDVLNPALSRPAVVVLPTSTSAGADALIATKAKTVQELKGKPVMGLEKSVSQYAFNRGLQSMGEDPADYSFQNMDPAAAAQAMQAGRADAIVVWNPFVLQTLEKNPDARVLFDSTAIPGEIIDTVAVSADSLKKPGGDRFAAAVADAFYQVSGRIDAPATRDETLVALGAKFSNLDATSMATVVEQTKFYKTPAAARELMTGAELKETMGKVVGFAVEQQMVPSAPEIGYGPGGDAPLRFDPEYLPK